MLEQDVFDIDGQVAVGPGALHQPQILACAGQQAGAFLEQCLEFAWGLRGCFRGLDLDCYPALVFALVAAGDRALLSPGYIDDAGIIRTRLAKKQAVIAGFDQPW
ncbi:hypothetical protein D3C76_1592990 [compost metagenome]